MHKHARAAKTHKNRLRTSSWLCCSKNSSLFYFFFYSLSTHAKQYNQTAIIIRSFVRWKKKRTPWLIDEASNSIRTDDMYGYDTFAWRVCFSCCFYIEFCFDCALCCLQCSTVRQMALVVSNSPCSFLDLEGHSIHNTQTHQHVSAAFLALTWRSLGAHALASQKQEWMSVESVCVCVCMPLLYACNILVYFVYASRLPSVLG